MPLSLCRALSRWPIRRGDRDNRSLRPPISKQRRGNATTHLLSRRIRGLRKLNSSGSNPLAWIWQSRLSEVSSHEATRQRVREFVKEFTTGHQEKPASKMRLVIKVSWELAMAILPALLVALFINVFVAEAALVEHRSTSNKCNTKTITISWA